MRKRYLKEKCSICNKRKTKNNYIIDSKLQPVCNICRLKLLLKKDANKEINEVADEKYSNVINLFLTITMISLTIGILLCAETISDFSDVINVFKDNTKIIYIILFSILNFCFSSILNHLNKFTGKICKYINILFNILITIVLNFVGCVIVIKNDLSWLSFERPFIYFILITGVSILVFYFLNRKKNINKKFLLYGISLLMIITLAIILGIGIKIQFNI